MNTRWDFLLTLFTLILVAGCSPGLVTINYRQAGNFTRWQYLDQSGEIRDGVYVKYTLLSIANQDQNAVNFNFDPAKLSVNGQRPTPFIFVGQPTPLTVPKGTTFTYPNTGTAVIVKVAGGDRNVTPFLGYDPSGYRVLPVKIPPTGTPPFFDPYTNSLTQR